MKRALDDAVIQEMKNSDYSIDYTYFDLKLALGISACAVACLAQFYPLKYPANFWLLVCCVSVYAALSTAMTYVITFLEKDCFLFTKPNSSKCGVSLAIASRLPKYQDQYELRIQLRGQPKGREQVSLKKSVTSYFDSEGHLAAELIHSDFRSLLGQFETTCSAIRKSL